MKNPKWFLYRCPFDAVIITRVIITLLISLIPFEFYSQQAFTLKNVVDNSVIKIDKSFSANTEIMPFTSEKPITGLVISCDIVLNSDTSLVRVILVDENQTEFLVCEVYSLLIDSNIISLKDYGEETVQLNNIIPNTLKVEIRNASIYLKEVTTSQQEQYIAKIALEKSQQRHSDKIKKINENIKKKGGLWAAGETSISSMTYEEKKQLFGGSIPNLQGFEYYIGGIFVMPGTNLQLPKVKIESPYVEEFSWRNRHGQDWVTPVRNQGSCGSCWAFAATGATELLVNLYFNRHINTDLSEQQLVSCSGDAGNCSGGLAFLALDYIKSTGIVDENCFPYQASNFTCDQCAGPSEKVKIGGWSNIYTSSIDSVKRKIIKGPVSFGIAPWKHAITLVGYKTLNAGDQIYLKTSTQDMWITIPDGDPLIGETAWLLKNSWGTNFGENGYAYVVTDPFDINLTYEVNGPVTSLIYNDNDILCVDNDGDGYYTWGIGTKPSQCPQCPEEPDGDDSDPCLGPMDEFGYIKGITPPPVVNDVTISEINPVPELTAQGNNIRWYQDTGLDSLVYEGNNFRTGHMSIGIYKYNVTQTLSDCESLASKVTLSILPLPPLADDVTVCTGQEDIVLTATGQNIKWYSDRENPLFDNRDRQLYQVVTIGDQIWMSENLNYYTPSGSHFDNDSLSYTNTFGRLYECETALEVCPAEWHLPSRNDWRELRDHLGGEYVAGGKMKETGFALWEQPNTGATNESGFNAKAGGIWATTPTTAFVDLLGRYTAFLSSEGIPEVWWLSYDNSHLKVQYFYTDYGFSVRCMRYLYEPIASGDRLNVDYRDPGIYIYYVTQTINGIESQPDTVVLTINPTSGAPNGDDIMLCEGEQVPNLIAAGENIQWYSDSELTNLEQSGNVYSSVQTQSGIYKYYATQTISGCEESQADTIILTIFSIPPAPITQNVSVCENQTVPELTAVGENVRWFGDSILTNLIYSGNSYSTGKTDTGKYTYYITQTISGCESDFGIMNLYINPVHTNNILTAVACNSYESPSNKYTWISSGIYSDTIPNVTGCDSVITIDLTIISVDTSVAQNQSVLTAHATEAAYQWIDCDNSNTPIEGETHQTFVATSDGNYAVIVSQNGCIDTSACLTVNVNSLTTNVFKHHITIYPNPNDGSFSIDLGSAYPTIEITITELDGRILQKERRSDSRNVDMTMVASPGMYMVIITAENERAVFKILKR